MDRDAGKEKLKELSGKAGEIAKLYLAARSGGQKREANLRALREALNLPGRDMSAVFDDGPRQAFEALHGKAVADWAGRVAERLRLYAYSPSSYRRSFRSENAELSFGRFLYVLDTLLFSWEGYDMVRELSNPRRGDKNEENVAGLADFCSEIYGDFLAVRIDEGDRAVIDAVEEVMLGDNNTAMLSDPIISGITKSENAELRGLLVNMLLAARLQEGLRQSILENADTGRVETLVVFMKAILDNDLLRYSSVVRAADVWMGLGLEAGDRRVTQKLLELGYAYLKDEKARKAAVKSKDVIELYAALWAESAVEINRVTSLADRLMAGKKYQQLVFLSFLTQTENPALQFGIAAKYLERYAKNAKNAAKAAKIPEKDELDVLCLVMQNYSLRYSYLWRCKKEDYREHCQTNTWIADKKTRDAQFEALLNIIPAIPAGGYKKENTPFPWSSLSIALREIFQALMSIAGYDFDPEKTDRLIAVMDGADSANRSKFIKFFLDAPDNETKREYLFASLNDKSMPVRSQALENIVALEITDAEIPRVMSLLALKTGDIRQNAVRVLSNLETGRALSALKALLADKNDHKRLAGLDLLARMLKENRIGRDAVAGLVALMPEATDKEQVLIDALDAEEAAYSEENGFGLYDPNYAPQLPVPAPDKNNTLDSIFGVDVERLRKIFAALCDVIEANRDFTYRIHTWQGDEDAVLGTLTRALSRAGICENESLSAFERFVLQDAWRAWIRDNQVSYRELLLLMFIDEMPYQGWMSEVMEDIFHAKNINPFIAWYIQNAQKKHGRLAMSIAGILWTEFPESERFAVLEGAIADLLAKVDEEKWKLPLRENIWDVTWYGEEVVSTFSDTCEVIFILRHLALAVSDDDRFTRYVGVCFELGRRTGKLYRIITVEQAARAVTSGILKEDALYRFFFMADRRNVSSYFGNIQDKDAKETVEKFPVVKEIADRCVARIIEIELLRGDSKTAVSHLASKIRRHEGADTFAKILVALGNETLFRGYYYSDTALTKKDVLSHLLRTCHPKESDTAETLRACLGGRISDRRVIEAAMYSPSWLDILEDYLGWPGFKSAAWYFHAHVSQTFSAEKETEVARYSPIAPEEFNDGAFDLAWFWEAWNALGAERFDLVYACAKYLGEGAGHRRAQLFADAALGRLDAKSLAKEIHDKRNKDKLLSYSLIPLDAGGFRGASTLPIQKTEEGADSEPRGRTGAGTRSPAPLILNVYETKMAGVLERYQFIQAFLRESKIFGAQRRESEGKACLIATGNLARNAGFTDALRFAWRMETLEADNLKKYFEPKTFGNYTVKVLADGDGNASLTCERDGKTISSMPAALKKDAYVVECKEAVAALKQQYRRARENFEKIMIDRDVFSPGELKDLMAHPVVSPILRKLVFVTVDAEGKPVEFVFFHELQDWGGSVRVAHPFDLYTLGTWTACQCYAFETRLVQPFKQIFRELYLVNDDEKREGTLSRRYAGHQVQPQRAVALLKGRGWTVDYEEGLQRVYHKENIYVKLYAAADWFSPADIEAATLETVEFFNRRTHKRVPLETIAPVIFSETMRDIDLAVSVAHAGGVDPEASHSTVEMRAAIVRELLSLLHIRNVRVENRFAKIEGSLGEYTVHLGSAQAAKTGRGALNILAVPGQHRGRVFLPFADDDPRTAEIMSKIILLAEDGAIKDPAILAQIS